MSIDHIPFHAPNRDVLRNAFARLGFTVSPRGVYRDEGAGRWPNYAVFLQSSWFDLIESASAPPPFRPGGVLLKDEDAALTEARTPYRLTRTWEHVQSATADTFEIRGIAARIAPLPIALIKSEQAIDPAWRDHPNSAQEIVAISFSSPPGEAHERLSLQHDFAALRFNADALTIHIRVIDLNRAGNALAQTDIAFTRASHALTVPAQGDLGCGFVFSG